MKHKLFDVYLTLMVNKLTNYFAEYSYVRTKTAVFILVAVIFKFRVVTHVLIKSYSLYIILFKLTMQNIAEALLLKLLQIELQCKTVLYLYNLAWRSTTKFRVPSLSTSSQNSLIMEAEKNSET